MDDKMIPLSEAQAMVAAALEEASAFLDESALQKGYTKTPQGRTAIYYARKIRALIPDGGTALQRALDAAREEGRREEREACALLLDGLHRDWILGKGRNPEDYTSPYSYVAAAIRARGDV